MGIMANLTPLPEILDLSAAETSAALLKRGLSLATVRLRGCRPLLVLSKPQS